MLSDKLIDKFHYAKSFIGILVTVDGFRGSAVQESEVALVSMLFRCGNVHPVLERRNEWKGNPER